MARSPIAFRTCFDAACRAIGFTAAQVDADTTLRAKLLQLFNRTYAIGYDFGGADGWEDARTGASISPDTGLIEYDTLGDAREFQIWNEDPRGNSDAVRLAFTTNSAGILLDDHGVAEVWVTWLPEVVKFTTTAWVTSTAYVVGDTVLFTTTGKCYRCLTAHTSGTFATDLAASKWVLMPVLSVLEEFCICYFQGTHLREEGQPETGFKLQQAALAALEEKALKEINRNQRGIVRNWAIVSGAVPASSNQRYLRFDAAQTLTNTQRAQALTNLAITFTSGGYLRLVDGSGNIFNIGLNTGEPP